MSIAAPNPEQEKASSIDTEECYDCLILALPSLWIPPHSTVPTAPHPAATSLSGRYLEKFGRDFNKSLIDRVDQQYFGELLPGQAIIMPINDWFFSQLYKNVLVVCSGPTPFLLYPFPFSAFLL